MHTSHNDPQMVTWFQAAVLLHVLCAGLLYIRIEGEGKEEPDPIEPRPAQVIFKDPPRPDPPNTDPTSHELKVVMNESSNFGATSLFQDIPEMVNEDSNESDDIIDPPIEPPIKDTPKILVPEPENIETSPLAKKLPILDHKKEDERQPLKSGKLSKKKSASPITGLTLANLAEGFLNYTKRNNRTSVPLNSGNLKTAAYDSKIAWYLQNSFQIHNRPLKLTKPVSQYVTFYFEIDKDGKLLNLDMRPKTGEPTLDKHLLKCAQNAYPMAPLPKHFDTARYRYHTTIFVNTMSGTHRYQLMFGD